MLSGVRSLFTDALQFPQGHRLGRIYGCGDHGVKRSGPSDRIYFMGRSGAEKKGDAEQSEASDIDSAAPESAVGISWIFREQTV